ncbi:MAG: hypothetical protein HYT11_01745 [Candidatus Levybacteria bacterium]|nr:hypothetical protein [Candidatus Levybacteria bacterium]
MAKDASINLLRKQQKTGGFNVFLEWLLTYGRFIIIAVQTIALIALVYRYTLDRELEKVQKQIKERQAAIQERKEEENSYRNLHERLSLVETIHDSSKKNRDLFVETIATASGYLVFNNIVFEKNTIRINAYTSSIGLFNSFVKLLREDDRIETINIGRVESDSSKARINIDISVSIKAVALGKTVL